LVLTAAAYSWTDTTRCLELNLRSTATWLCIHKSNLLFHDCLHCCCIQPADCMMKPLEATVNQVWCLKTSQLCGSCPHSQSSDVTSFNWCTVAQRNSHTARQALPLVSRIKSDCENTAEGQQRNYSVWHLHASTCVTNISVYSLSLQHCPH